MKDKNKKIISIIIIIILLPYIMMVFIKGEGVLFGTSSSLRTQIEVVENNEIITISWEEYLIGLLAKEIPTEYSFEAMKAQAIIIQTRLEIGKEEAEANSQVDYIYEEDFYTSEEIQIKWSGGSSVEIYNQLSAAVQETEGLKLYCDGELALTPYHTLNNGYTRNGNEVFLSEEYPYLVSVYCPLDLLADQETVSTTVTYSELVEQLDIELTQSADISFQDIEILGIDSVGYVLAINIQGNTINGETFRTELGLKSSAFTIEEDEEGIIITTLGNGHGLGLSQNTAHYMGLEGKTHEEILAYFYLGTEINNY